MLTPTKSWIWYHKDAILEHIPRERERETKASLRFREDDQTPVVKAKIPLTILGFPFNSSITAGNLNDLSFNLSTNSINGPSLKLTYTLSINPFSISLKFGVGFFGSPNNSPLIISAHFNPFQNPNPTFSLQIKPQFGDFSLKKTAISASIPPKNPNQGKENCGYGSDFYDNVVKGRWPVVDLAEVAERQEEFSSGTALTAKTVLPVTRGAMLKFRWGVNFPKGFMKTTKILFLTVDEGVRNPNGVCEKLGDLEVLKGMCFWMRNEVEVLQMENRAIKESLEEVRLGRGLNRGENDKNDNVDGKACSGFERWKNKNDGDDSGRRREVKKASSPESPAGELGEELKRAIKAASSNGV
ncbi:hypothetical protein GIB67_030497 [Kingdonia uniflora]|uniref:Uncharacterized protein n=1 Tax=Kingdonia uniflora TaxID=39325 RepID=A0A7J7M2H0_9MAGN|nr:hypothetical protein GIB67_030497 [Kingdonia uniflora]